MRNRQGEWMGGAWLGMAALALTGCAAGEQDKKNLEAGFASYGQRQYVEAERAALVYIQKYPADKYVDEAYYLRGLARLGMGDRAGAEKDLIAAIAKADRDDLKAKANRALGDMACEYYHWDAAIGYYQASIQATVGPDARKPAGEVDAAVYERLGASLQAVGKWGEAAGYLDRVLTSNADGVVARRAELRRRARAFELQFGVYADVGNAQKEIATLKGQGVMALPVNETRDGKTAWYVRAGNYRTFAEAEAARQALAARKVSAMIVP